MIADSNLSAAAERANGEFTTVLIGRLLRDRDRLFEEMAEGRDTSRTVRALAVATVALLSLYGLCLGAYNGLAQSISSMVKFPLLFFLTVLVCYPILYVFNVLFGSRVRLLGTLAILLASIAMMSVILGAFAPITLFFVISDSSYEFMKLLHVATVGTAAIIGLGAMYRGLTVVCEKSDIYPKRAMSILRVWLLVFAFVGTQMVWTLRPLVGSKEKSFELIRKSREGNFYQAVVHAARELVHDRK